MPFRLITAIGLGSGCAESGAGSSSTSSVPAALNSASLSWEKPATNDDSSPVTDLAGYQVSYAQATPVTTEKSTSIPVSSPNQTSYVVADLAPGTYHFAVTAVDL